MEFPKGAPFLLLYTSKRKTKHPRQKSVQTEVINSLSHKKLNKTKDKASILSIIVVYMFTQKQKKLNY